MCNRGADRVRLAHDATALHVYVDVDRIDFLPRELQRLEDLQGTQLKRIDLDRHTGDSHGPSPPRERRPRARGLSLPARDDRLHRGTSNFEAKKFDVLSTII